jgi:hypothetical protein
MPAVRPADAMIPAPLPPIVTPRDLHTALTGAETDRVFATFNAASPAFANRPR